jgi:hypothetical protein
MQMVGHDDCRIYEKPARTMQPTNRVKHYFRVISLREYRPSASD